MPTSTTSLICPPDEMVGKTLHEVMPQPLADRMLAGIQTALDQQTTQNAEYYVKRDGQMIWLAASISPLDSDRAILVARDISERKQREEALQLIAKGTAETIGDEFFNACTRVLAQALGIRYVLVGRFADADHRQIEAIAFWTGEDFYPEKLVYALNDTPCERVLNGNPQFWAQASKPSFLRINL
ncbi:MAG: PAS domain S-box protein [Spirulinaceae cyanobacterium RM2_2_10]|nr:PAS domain S-box protein [Spirulinaceae cyanobacterium RM2_2_10]